MLGLAFLLLTIFPTNMPIQQSFRTLLGIPEPPRLIVIAWGRTLAYVPDPIDPSKRLPAFEGRLYLFGEYLSSPLQGDGSLQVEMFDVTNGVEVKREQWDIAPQTLALYLRKDLIGSGYSLSLPSRKYKLGDATVRLRICYKPAKGIALFSNIKLTFHNDKVTESASTSD